MTLVIVGATIRDAQSAAMQRREQDRGKSVRLLSVGSPAAARGLRVSEVLWTEHALNHPNSQAAARMKESLDAALLKNGDQ